MWLTLKLDPHGAMPSRQKGEKVVEIADVSVSLPVEAEYQVLEDEVFVHRVFVRSGASRLEVTNLLTPDDWHEVLYTIHNEYTR